MVQIQDSAAKPGRGYAGVIAIIVIPQIMFSIDFSTANVALASIARDLAIGPGLLAWVITGFSLSYAGFLILGGRIADLYGRRNTCIVGLSAFIAGELVSAMATSAEMLIAGRAIVGLASALAIPSSFSLINILLPDDATRNRAYSVFSACQGVALILGMCGGGALTTIFGWRAAFLIDVPLAIISLILAFRVIPVVERRADAGSLDIAGAVLITIGIGAALMSLSMLGNLGWTSPKAWSVLGFAALVLLALFFVEKVVRDPLVPPSIFRFPNMLGANLGSMFVLAATAGIMVLANLLMQKEMHFSAMQSGLGMIPYAAAVTIAGRAMGPLMTRFPLRRMTLAAMVIFVVACLLLATIAIDRGYAINMIPGMLIFGVGSTAATIPLMALATSAVPAETQGVATGAMITFQQIGLALGISAALAMMGAQMGAGITPDMAFRSSFLLMAAIAIVAMLSVLLLTREPRTGTVVMAH
jgi:MFS family permease